MRSYGQYCSVAKALDVVGDRWTLLIIRELLIRGACRYTDLRDGLPGIATNLLSDRIRELEAAGLIRREDAPPPIATTLFHLTDTGAELRPVLDAIGQWGVRYMTGPADGDQFRGHWASFWLRDRDPGGPPVSIELRSAGSPVVIEVAGGSVTTRPGTAAAPDLVLRGEPHLILALFSGQLTAPEVTDRGLEISGDASVLQRVLPQPADETRTETGQSAARGDAARRGHQRVDIPVSAYPGHVSEMPISEATGHLDEIADESAATGEVIYLTRDGRRLAAIVPANAAAEMEAAEDAADIAVAVAEAAMAEPGEDIPASVVWAELSLADDE